MYGKIFDDIYGSSLMVHGGDTVYVFISMVVLSDKEGYLREHPAAFANRIGKNFETVKTAITHLEAEDAESSSPEHNGRRIIPLRELTGGHENRGWFVVNKKKYKLLASKEDQRGATAERVRNHRTRNANVTPSNGSVTDGNACNSNTDTDVNTDTKKTSPGDVFVSEHFFQLIQALNPKHKTPNFKAWANDIRLMRERDGRTLDEIRELFQWANDDPFWKTNILSPATLRKQWDKLVIQRNNRRPNATHQRVDTSAPGRVRAANRIVR